MESIAVIPTYNESENLSELIQKIHTAEPALDILVVDDASPDGTGELAEEMAAADRRIQVLHRSGKLGLGTAYIAGFHFALTHGYRYVIEMDADFSHRPEDLPALLAAARTADVVVGSREVPGGYAVGRSFIRRAISKGGSLYARLVLGLPVRDCTGGYKCFRRYVLEVLDLDMIKSNGYAFQIEVNYACASAGFNFAEVPIVFPDRQRGKSKMSMRIFLEAAWLVLRLRLGLTCPAILGEARAIRVEA